MADLPQPGYLPAAGGNPIGFTDYYDNNLDGVLETSFRTPPSTSAASNQVVDPDRHQPFIDECERSYIRRIDQLRIAASQAVLAIGNTNQFVRHFVLLQLLSHQYRLLVRHVGITCSMNQDGRRILGRYVLYGHEGRKSFGLLNGVPA